jgi:hypothetical protein
VRLIVTGARDGADYASVSNAIEAYLWKSGVVPAGLEELITPCSRGVAAFAERWAAKNAVRLERRPALWATVGTKAGPLRDKVMAERATHLLVLHADQEPDLDMVSIVTIMRKAKKPVEAIP